jgi:hypothetical protein
VASRRHSGYGTGYRASVLRICKDHLHHLARDALALGPHSWIALTSVTKSDVASLPKRSRGGVEQCSQPIEPQRGVVFLRMREIAQQTRHRMSCRALLTTALLEILMLAGLLVDPSEHKPIDELLALLALFVCHGDATSHRRGRAARGKHLAVVSEVQRAADPAPRLARLPFPVSRAFQSYQ